MFVNLALEKAKIAGEVLYIVKYILGVESRPQNVKKEKKNECKKHE